MRQKADLLGRIVLLLLLTATLDTGSAKANPPILDELQGEWLNKNYVETLKKTRSPMKAVGGYPTAFKISKDDQFYRWLLIYGFHEGVSRDVYLLTPTNEKNTYLVKHDIQKPGTFDKFVIKKEGDIDEITWMNENRNKKKSFSFIRARPNIDVYINRIVLAGSYKDIEGRSFMFDESGEATWPEKAFRYQINLDQEGMNCDMFSISNGLDIIGYGFTWKNTKLLISNLREKNDNIYCDKQPWLILFPQ